AGPSIPHAGGVWTVAFNAAGDRLATGGVDDTVRVWDTLSSNLISELVGDGGDVKSVTFVGDRVVSASDDGTLRIWSTARLPRPYPGPPARVTDLSFPAGRITSVNAAGFVQTWDGDGNPVGPPKLLDSGATAGPVATADGTTMASGTGDGLIRAWDVGDARPVGPAIATGHGNITVLAFGGGRIASRAMQDTEI